MNWKQCIPFGVADKSACCNMFHQFGNELRLEIGGICWNLVSASSDEVVRWPVYVLQEELQFGTSSCTEK